MKETEHGSKDILRRLSFKAWRRLGSGLLILMLLGAFLFRAPAAWAAPLHQDQQGAVNEAQEGLDEQEGPNNDAQINQSQDGVEELDGQNHEAAVSESQEGVDEQEGQNGELQQVGENQTGEGDTAPTTPAP